MIALAVGLELVGDVFDLLTLRIGPLLEFLDRLDRFVRLDVGVVGDLLVGKQTSHHGRDFGVAGWRY